MSKQVKQVDLAGQLREAIANSGLNRHQLAKRTGISYSVVHGFVGRECDITLGTASKMYEVIGAELRSKAGRTKKGR